MTLRTASCITRVSHGHSDFPWGLLLSLLSAEVLCYTAVEDSFLRGLSRATYREVPRPFVVGTKFLYGLANSVRIFAVSTQDRQSTAAISEGPSSPRLESEGPHNRIVRSPHVLMTSGQLKGERKRKGVMADSIYHGATNVDRRLRKAFSVARPSLTSYADEEEPVDKRASCIMIT